MGDGKTYVITNQNVIRDIIRSMNGKIAQVKGDMVWYSTIKKPIKSVGIVYESKSWHKVVIVLKDKVDIAYIDVVAMMVTVVRSELELELMLTTSSNR